MIFLLWPSRVSSSKLLGPLYKYAMPVWVSRWNVSPREDGFPGSPRENHPPEGRHSITIPTLAWHICFIIPNKPQFGKISIKTTMTAGRSSENGGRFAGGHFAGGHDGMANLRKPITVYDFHVRYNKYICPISMSISKCILLKNKIQYLCKIHSIDF